MGNAVKKISTPEIRGVFVKSASEKIMSSMLGRKIANNEKAAVPKMTEQDRKYILKKTRDDTLKFEVFTGMKLESWYV